MNSFDTLMQSSAAPMLFTMLGDPRKATYTDPDGNTTQCTAVLHAPTSRRETSERAETDDVEHGTVIISTDPASAYGYVTNVELGGTVTFDGSVWGIEDITSRSATFYRLRCSRWRVRDRDVVERR
jgi:hypothetical protein